MNATLKLVFFFCIYCISQNALAQTDSTKKEKIKWFTFNDTKHSPTKASVYSAIIPGLGQAYNRKYWKIPIVYGALVGGTITMIKQREKMRAMNDRFRGYYAMGTAPTAEEITQRNNYRQNRDIGILVVTAFYALQIVDATVDAHFYKVDLNENLNVQLKPSSNFLHLTYSF